MSEFQDNKPTSTDALKAQSSPEMHTFTVIESRARVHLIIEDMRGRALAEFTKAGKSEAVLDYLTLRFSPLFEQYNAMPAGSPMRGVVSECLIAIAEGNEALLNTADWETALLSRLYDAKTDEVTKFLIRELVVTFKLGGAEGNRHAGLEDACTFAKHMTRLKRNMAVEDGPTIQADLERITKSPDAWRSLLSHIIEHVIRGSNQHHLIPCLLDNVSDGCSAANREFLQELAGDPHNSEEVKQIALYLLGEVPSWQVLPEEPPIDGANDPEFPGF